MLCKILSWLNLMVLQLISAWKQPSKSSEDRAKLWSENALTLFRFGMNAVWDAKNERHWRAQASFHGIVKPRTSCLCVNIVWWTVCWRDNNCSRNSELNYNMWAALENVLVFYTFVGSWVISVCQSSLTSACTMLTHQQYFYVPP